MAARIASKLTGVPLVYHVHSPAKHDSTRPWQNWANALVERWSVRRADRLICVSASLAQYMRDAGFPAERIRVVPNGVPPSPDLPRRRAPTDTWTLGTVALFRPRKGSEVLIEALAHLMRQGLPVRLRLVGPFETPEYESQIRSLARDCGVERCIDWVGFTSDVNAELAKMDVFVLPSLFGEGLPMVVLEAMAAGVPVVGTDVEGIPEAVRHSRDGLIARPNDPDDLARAVADFIDGVVDWATLRASAICRHAEHFSDSSMATGVADVYTEVLTSPP
jgi:glycosyltransferase involved in cell wall biosynthesis